jgi:hypothetical protein
MSAVNDSQTMSDHPHTREAMERWRQGKINVFDALAELEDQRDQWRECAERLAKGISMAPLIPTNSMELAVAEFNRLGGEIK